MAPALLAVVLAACARAPAPEPPRGVEARRSALVDELRGIMRELEADGRYDCCVETACLRCTTRGGGCACGPGLRKGDPVCEECAMWWMRGKGEEPGIDPDTVRSFLEAAHQEKAKSECNCPAHEGAVKTEP